MHRSACIEYHGSAELCRARSQSNGNSKALVLIRLADERADA